MQHRDLGYISIKIPSFRVWDFHDEISIRKTACFMMGFHIHVLVRRRLYIKRVPCSFLCLRLQAPEALCFRVVRPSVRLSVRPKPEIPSFDLYMGPLVHPTNRNRFTACPSVRPSGEVSGHLPENAWREWPEIYMLMYLDHLQNWLVYGRRLLIFLILALFWLSETGQIWGFRAFPGERIKEMAWNFACWCILTTSKTD